MRPDLPVLPFLAALLAIALYSLMDVAMKQAAIAVGAYSAVLWRNAIGFAVAAPLHAAGRPRWPDRQTLRLHLLRGVVGAFTALTFFSALVLLPVAEAIAISFISPLAALGMAALILKEKVRRQAIWASLLGLAGVGVIVAGRMGARALDADAVLGIALVLASALAYAWNLILQRQQALRARPVEIMAWQSGLMAMLLLAGAPWLLHWPAPEIWLVLAGAALLALAALGLQAWAFARAEAQVLVPLEYSAFAWAALFGWWLLGEPVLPATVAGAVLIIAACLLAAPPRRPG